MVLITGATGLVGSHLALQLLENNEKLRAIFRTEESRNKTKSVFAHYKKESLFQQIEWVQAGITDIPTLEAAFQEVDFVYHCAAVISFDPDDEKEIRKTNIEGTANIVNLCLEYKIKKLCHISSIAAIGDLKTNETLINENTEWNPEVYHSDYAISKYGAEIEVFRGQQEGLQTIIINPGIILGPYLWQTGSGELYKKIKKGFPFYTKGATGFVTVNDVAKICIQLMKSPINGERFIAIADNITFENISKSIAKELKVKAPSINISPLMAGIGWRIDWVVSNLFRTKRKLSKSMALALNTNDVISANKTKEVLGYEFQDIEKYLAVTLKNKS